MSECEFRDYQCLSATMITSPTGLVVTTTSPVGILLSRWWGYLTVKKNFEDICNRLGTIPACDRQTDRQTDILPRHS